MNKELNKLQRDAQKKYAVKAQLSVRKKILGQKALTPSVFAFSAKGEQFPLTQLVENLASLLSNPQDIDPECVQLDKCLQQPQILLGKFLRHKWVIDSGEEVWFDGRITELCTTRVNTPPEFKVLYEESDEAFLELDEIITDVKNGDMIILW